MSIWAYFQNSYSKLTTDQRWGTERPAAIPIIQRWDCNERQKNKNTCSNARQSTKTAAPEPHREDKSAGTYIHLLDQHDCWHRRNGKKLSHLPWFPSNTTKDRMSHELPGRMWESLPLIISIFLVLYITTANSQSIKHVEDFSTDNLIKTFLIIFYEYRLPSNILSDVGTNVISEKFRLL